MDKANRLAATAARCVQQNGHLSDDHLSDDQLTMHYETQEINLRLDCMNLVIAASVGGATTTEALVERAATMYDFILRGSTVPVSDLRPSRDELAAEIAALDKQMPLATPEDVARYQGAYAALNWARNSKAFAPVSEGL